MSDVSKGPQQPSGVNPLEFGLLGSPRLRLNGYEIKLVLKKVLGLMVYLALEGATSRSKLVSLLWSNLDEDSARRNLRRELHRLKTRVTELEGWLEAVDDALRLAQPFSTDVQGFLEAIKHDDLEGALGLYTGLLLDGFELDGADGFHEWLEARRDHLDHEHARVMLELAERLETRGDWRRALDLHLKLLERDPLQERTHRGVMRLHYLLDEREAAFAQFEQLQHVLSSELGLMPLPETVQLLEQIRSTQTITPIVTTVTAERLDLQTPMLGREAERAQLMNPQGAVLLIGEPGVGKTRLLSEVFRSTNTVWVRFSAGPSQTPLSAVARVIRESLHTNTAQTRLGDLERVWRLEVARLVPELEPDVPLEPVSGNEARNRFLEGLGRALRAIGDVLVFEDLHWADASSLELARWLSRAPEPRPLILSARPAELEENEPASELTRQLEWASTLERMVLKPLGEDSVRELVALNAPNAGQAFTQRLMNTTQGNPFFVLETLRYVLERSDTRETLPVPPTVRDAVLERVKRLGNATKRLLEVASLTDDGFSLAELTPATALTDFEGVDALERAVNAHVLNRLERGYAFTHDLARQAIQVSISAERRTLIHGKLADTLLSMDAAPARVAYHLEMAGKRQEAVSWRIRAGQAATNVYAHHEALGHYQKALENGATGHQAFTALNARTNRWLFMGETERASEELTHLKTLVAALHDPALGIDLELTELRLMRRVGRLEEVVVRLEQLLERPEVSTSQRNELLLTVGVILAQMGKLPAAEAHLQRTLNHIADMPTLMRARIHATLGSCARDRRDYDAALEYSRLAQSEFDGAGNLDGVAGEIINQSYVQALQGDVAGAIPGFERAFAQAAEIGDVEVQVVATINLGHYSSYLLRFDEALRWLETGLKLAEDGGFQYQQGTLLINMAEQHRFRGQLGAALDAIQHATKIAREASHGTHQAIYLQDLADFYLELGHLELAQHALDDAARVIDAGGLERLRADLYNLYAQLEVARGQPGAAVKRVLEGLDDLDCANPDERDALYWLQGLAHLAWGQFEQALESSTLIVGEEPMTSAARHVIGLTAGVSLAQVDVQDLEHALGLLSERMKPASELDLRCALVRAAEHISASFLPGLRTQSRHRLLELAETLNEYPDLKRSFLGKYRVLLAEGSGGSQT